MESHPTLQDASLRAHGRQPFRNLDQLEPQIKSGTEARGDLIAICMKQKMMIIFQFDGSR
jgi:hypothetical protein